MNESKPTISQDELRRGILADDDEILDRFMTVAKEFPGEIGLINLGKKFFLTRLRATLDSLLTQLKMQEVVLSAAKEEKEVPKDFVDLLEKDIKGYEEMLFRIDKGLHHLATLDGCPYDSPLEEYAKTLDEAVTGYDH